MSKNVLEFLENSVILYPNKKAVADDRESMNFTELMSYAKSAGTAIASVSCPRKPIPVFSEKSCCQIQCL